jgi:uncharacterized protein (TIGR00297 family)
VTLPFGLSGSLAGAVIVVAVAMAAGSAGYLARSGVVAAIAVGVASVLAGPAWAAMLLFFFVTSTALSMWRADAKRSAQFDIVDKGSRRDAMQVIANGGVFAAAAVASVWMPADAWQALGAGAIAAATSDTWSTEVGTAVGGIPRHLLTGKPVPPGFSGGITAAGSAAAVAGAATVAALAWLLDWHVSAMAVLAGGLTGSAVDSLLGATVQERRWCAACGKMTERRRHSCGTETVVRGGIAGVANDLVNLTSVIAGAVMAGVVS